MSKNSEEKINNVYKFIYDFVEENGYSPSIREICYAMDISSTSLASYYLNKLRKDGRIDFPQNKKRSLSLTENRENAKHTSYIPIVGTVSAGTGILAEQNIEGYFPISKAVSGANNASADADEFVLKVNGYSMKNAGILSGDYVIIHRQEDADNGDIVLAFWQDDAVIKRYYRRQNSIVLHPENESMEDIVLSAEDEPKILGKVVGVYRKY